MTLPANLTDTLTNLSGAARALTDEVRDDKIARGVEARAALAEQRRANRWMLTLLVIVALLVGGLAMISISNRKLGVANAALNKQNAQIVHRIEDCTTVGGDCYEESAGRTQAAVGQLLRVNIAVALCAKTNDTQPALELCVRKYMATPAATAAPAPTPTP